MSLMPHHRRPPVPLPLATALGLLCAATSAHAQTEPLPTLEQCAAIAAASDRLTCYDRLAGRAPAPQRPTAQQAPLGEPPLAQDEPSRLLPKNAPAMNESARSQYSVLSRYWELDPQDKRGVFNAVGYQSNFFLPLHVTSRINRAPQSPTQAASPEPGYRREEAKFQLSLRTKLLQGVGLPNADLWAAFTMQTLWQVYNRRDSSPFRNTDYQPELIYVVPTAPSLRQLPLGWQWRYTQLGWAHQSNGQSDPLSRSWNRVYLGAGIERGNWSLSARLNHRLSEDAEDDNNPDLMNYRGRGEFTLGWASGLHTASLQLRTSLRAHSKGAAQFEWTYPVSRDQPNGLRWYVQLFHGYGETLTDYNFRQSSIGAGVSFLQF